MRRKLLFFLGLIGLGAAAYLLLPGDFDSALFWASFRETRPWWIAGAVATTFLGYALRAIRWHVLLRPLKPVPYLPLMNATVIGFGAIYTLGRPGELVRPVWIGRQEGIPLMGAVASIIVERVFDLMMLLLLFVAGSMWVELPEETRRALGGLGTPWQLVGLVAAALAGFVLLHKYSGSLARFMPFHRLRTLMETFAQGLAGTSSPRSVTVLGLYSLLLWSVHALQFWLMLGGLNLPHPFAGTLLTLVLTSLGSIAQIPGIGGGFQAGFIVSSTAVLGAPAEVSVAASLTLWFISTVPTILAAAGYMMWKGISARDLRVEETELHLTP